MPELIVSLSNPLVKQARSLRQKKGRAETGLFLVEGIHHVGEAAEAGWDIRAVLYAPDLLAGDYARGLIAQLESKHIRTQPVSARVMKSLADKENPTGLIALVSQRAWTLAGLSASRVASALALVSPQDAGNLGSILRTMDAVGFGTLFLLDGGVDEFHPSVIRASMGAIFWKTIIRASFDDFLQWSHERGMQLIAASAHARNDYRSVKPISPWALVLGSEQKGLSAAQVDACSASVSLPMRGRASSLNLSVAAGILLYQFTDDKITDK